MSSVSLDRCSDSDGRVVLMMSMSPLMKTRLVNSRTNARWTGAVALPVLADGVGICACAGLSCGTTMLS